MTVRVLLFAYLRERAGVREVALEVAEGVSVGYVWEQLCARHEFFAQSRPRFARNQVYVDKAETLHDNDELAVIPPVSGGAGDCAGDFVDLSHYRRAD